jgi:hypothetical protein
MPRFWFGLSLFLLAASSVFLVGQQTTPQRDPAALTTISTALTAMGLPLNASQINTIALTGSVSPASGSQDPAGTFTSVVQLGTNGYEVRNEFVSNGNQSLFVSNHGSPGFVVGGTYAQMMSGHVTMITAPSQLPMLELIRALSSSNYAVSQAAPSTVDGVAAVHVHISDETDYVSHAVTQQEWFFNPSTGLPLRWQFGVPDTFNAEHTVWPGSKDFSSYQQMDGILLPTQILYSRGGNPASITTITSLQMNAPSTSSQFDLPPGVTQSGVRR